MSYNTNAEVLGRLQSKGPKRILSLDGGGIRGLITLEVLAEIERQLRANFKKPDLVLADYFDLIAGTSTGAIIATTLSLGWTVDRIRTFYIKNGERMFEHEHLWLLWRNKYSGERLKELLQEEFGDQTLGVNSLRTLLLLVMRNVSTDQPWVVSNNPNCRFNAIDRADSQLGLPLWQIVRASTAAPGFFPPETIQVGEHEFVFVDGSISSFTNPAFSAFLRAVALPFDIGWAAGEDNILVISVGTGSAVHKRQELKGKQYNLYQAATTVPQSLILSTVMEQDMLCRIFGNCLNGHQLDKEVGDLVGIPSPGGQHLFTYARYNEDLTTSGLARLGISDINPEDIQRIDSLNHIDALLHIGRCIGQQVKPEHLMPGFCDQRPP